MVPAWRRAHTTAAPTDAHLAPCLLNLSKSTLQVSDPYAAAGQLWPQPLPPPLPQLLP